MAKRLPHLTTRVFGRPLMVAQRHLESFLKGLGPRFGVFNVPESAMVDWDDDDDEDGPPAKPYVVTDDGIAIIPIQGTLVRKSSWLDSLCGMTSYATLDSQFSLAVQDPSVSGILLDINSPGGECSGVFDLADRMFNLRGTKPVYAIANDDCFSAAYALGSCADKLFVTRTGGVGSVGVICLHLDQSAHDEKEGLKYTAIFAGDRKNDFSPHNPLSDRALETEQAEVDRLYGMFVGLVSRNRGLSANTVQGTQAGLFFAENGVAAGLADAVGTFADAYAALLAAAKPVAQEQLAPIFTNAGASAAANSKEAHVPDNTIVADQTVPATSAGPAPAASQPPVAVPFYTEAEIDEIDDLCALAGKDLKAARAFRAARLKPSQVRKQLFQEREEEMSAQRISSAVAPSTSTEDEQSEMATNPDKNPIVQAATQMGRNTKRPPNSLALAHCFNRGIA
jgi:signal peptide peptidase SppA